jgi:hypothetical protein
MQAIIDAARVHSYYVQAEDLSINKLRRVFRKFKERYPDLLRDRFHAQRLRSAGKASHYLVILRPHAGCSGGFWLFASAPDAIEKWRDITDRHSRLIIYWWELVRHTRRGSASPSWTYRMQPEVKERITGQITEAVAKRWDDWLKRFLSSSSHWPGFSGIRKDRRELVRYARARWSRVRRISEDMPPVPTHYYARRKKRARNTYT